MVNERRLIYANKLREDWLLYGANENIYSTNDVLDSIDEAPTVDAVEVVHCKDCEHFMTDALGQQVCNRTFMMFHMESEDFCSYGERREDA